MNANANANANADDAIARIEMGAGYNGGLAIGRSLIFGVLAGRSVAEGLS